MASRFDGAAEFYSRTTDLPDAATLTVTFWAKISVDRNDFSSIFGLSQPGGSAGYFVLETSTDGTGVHLVAAYGGGGSSATSPDVAMSVGTWYFIALTKSGTTHTMYIAAAATAALGVDTFALAGSQTPTEMKIGASHFTGEVLNGCIAAVKIWSGAALTQAEIENERWFTVPIRHANLHQWHPLLTGGTGTDALADYSGNGRTLGGGTGSTTEDGPPILWSPSLRKRWSAAAVAGGHADLVANQGAYALAGQAAILRAARKIAAAQGGYATTGQNVILRVGRRIALTQGAYALTGQTAGFKAARTISLAQGAYSLAGQDVTLTYNSSAATYTMPAAQGAYALSGQAAGLQAARKITAGQGGYTLSGQSTGLAAGRKLSLDDGVYAVTGQSTGLVLSRKISIAQGSYVLTGQAVQFTYSGAIIPPTLAAHIFSVDREDRICAVDSENRRFVIEVKDRISPIG